jgi:hypothetical protein
LSSSTVQCDVGWPAPSPRAWPPVVELPLLSGYLASRSVVAPIGLTRSLRVVRRLRVPKHPGAPTSRQPHRGPSRRSKASGLPLSGLGPPSQFHQRHTARSGSTEVLSRPCSVRGSFPYSVLPVARSHIPPAGSHPTGYVASTGFRTLSTLCSPHDLPGLFHPGSALGVPLRGLFPARCRTPSRAPDPSGFWRASSRKLAAPSGIEHTVQILPAGLGFSQVTTALPPWVWPSRGILAKTRVSRATSSPPLSRFTEQAAC